MTATMTAYRMLNWREKPQKAEVEVPKPAAGQVLIKVAGVGVCGSDPKMRYIPKETGEERGAKLSDVSGH